METKQILAICEKAQLTQTKAKKTKKMNMISCRLTTVSKYQAVREEKRNMLNKYKTDDCNEQ